MKKIGVAADDITGANDIGIMFAQAGYSVDVYSTLAVPGESDVLIYDTNSRFDPQKIAYQKTYHTTEYLKQQGASQFFKKTCSVFRGNIGAEFDAMFDAINAQCAMIVLGFPDNGRTTINGIHYVYGELLENTQFKNDPMNPMTESNLKSILQKQTQRKVGNIFYTDIKKGHDHLTRVVAQKKREVHYLIFDVCTNADLQTIATVIRKEKMMCGASAIARYLNDKNNASQVFCNVSAIHDKTKGKLIMAGSLTVQTLEQIEYAHQNGVTLIEFDTTTSNNEVDIKKNINHINTKAINLINSGKDVLIHTSNTPSKVAQTKTVWQSAGISEQTGSQRLSEQISEIAATIITATEQNRIVIAGGDTSGSFCKKMNIKGMRIYREIQPGLPSCVTLSKHPQWLILKSGSFGTKDFFIRCINHLNEKE